MPKTWHEAPPRGQKLLLQTDDGGTCEITEAIVIPESYKKLIFFCDCDLGPYRKRIAEQLSGLTGKDCMFWILHFTAWFAFKEHPNRPAQHESK